MEWGSVRMWQIEYLSKYHLPPPFPKSSVWNIGCVCVMRTRGALNGSVLLLVTMYLPY